MKLNLPNKVRAGLYVFTAIGTPVITYLFAKDIIGELELALWGAEVTVISVMASLNVKAE
jgi:hypothetical protein